MKKHILLFLTLIMSMMVTAQVTIQMEKEGGVYKVPCTVNGVKMKFIFDTGAATVSMSQTMAQFLLDGDYLSVSDIKGTGQSQLADGSIVNHATIVLRDVEIGGMHIHNIDATVIEGQNAPLLLGQTAIQELGRVSIDGNKLIIHSIDNELTDAQIERLEQQLQKYLESDSYAAAIECIERIDEAVGLSEYGLWQLCYCYTMNEQYHQSVQACNRWLAKYEDSDELNVKKLIYGDMGLAYYCLKEYSKALLWYQKEMACYVVEDDEDNVMLIKRAMAYCYQGLNQPYRAKDFYEEYMNYKLRKIGVEKDDNFGSKIFHGKIKNVELGSDFYDFALILYELGDNSNADHVVICASQLGDGRAKKFCIDNGLRYTYSSLVDWNWYY